MLISTEPTDKQVAELWQKLNAFSASKTGPVAEEARGRGIGTQLLTTGEDHAKARGCRHAWLDTFSFQAPDFYAKRGYIVFGELEDYPPGHRRFFLRKAIG